MDDIDSLDIFSYVLLTILAWTFIMTISKPIAIALLIAGFIVFIVCLFIISDEEGEE